jgi:AGCS family alanine or glycine:cation symporter
VWDLADAMNALMAIPNLVALLLLSGVIAKETREKINGMH